MKQILLLCSIVLCLTTSCSKDNDSADRIVGTWGNDSSYAINGGEEQTSRDQWIFNDDNTGNYTEYSNGVKDYESAFTWSKEDSLYKVFYAEDEGSFDIFTIGNQAGYTTLEDSEGYLVAIKE